ncbi:major facilitator superfamily-like protein [Aureococcus anophagefferens]|nr:major facilitator superfamily-like protein [Aureococcus anophagefferens]
MATWFEHRVVAACSLCEAAHMYAICSLFAYAAFYVVDSGWASDRDAAGFVAGLLGSAVTLGRIPVAALWGAAADGFGRRRCVVASMAALAVGQVAFGVVESLPAVLASRALLGASCGWPVVFPIYASEALGPEKQSLLIGRAIALVGAAVAVAACAAAALWLPEERRAPAYARVAADAERELPEKGAKAIEAPPPEHEPWWVGFRAISGGPLLSVTASRMIFGFNEFAANEATSLGRLRGGAAGWSCRTARSARCSRPRRYRRWPSPRPRSRRRSGAPARGARRRRAAPPLSVAAMPFSRSPWAAGVAMALHGAGYICGQIGILTITNNAVESSRRGRVGGAMSTAEAVAKGLGPWSASVLFAESIRSGGAAFHAAVFLGLAALYATAAVLARSLPGRVDAAAS